MSVMSFGAFIVNFELISHLFSCVSVVDVEQVNVSWESPVNMKIHKTTYQMTTSHALKMIFHDNSRIKAKISHLACFT